VHILGVQDDDDFMRAMALCAAVALPCHEVGQSSPGPLALALEMDCRVLANADHPYRGSECVWAEGKFIRTQMQADGADARGLVHSICGRAVHLCEIPTSNWHNKL
jgi:hypothetical protein